MENDNNKSIKSALDAVKKKVFGTADDKLTDVDKALNRISDAIINKDSMNQSEVLKKLLSSTLETETFKQITSGNLTLSTELVSRLVRYINSEDVVDSIPFCARALQVLSNEIISPDDITKEMIQFLQSKTLSEEDERAFENVKGINDVLKVNEHLRDIVYETLKLGDQFIEICDYTSDNIPLSQSLLNEGGQPFEESESIDVSFNDTIVNEYGQNDIVKKNIKVTTIITEDTSKTSVSIDNIRLILHDPSFVVKLQSQRFKMCLGYIILPKSNTYNYSNVMYPSNRNISTNVTGLQFSSLSQEVIGIDKLYMDVMNKIKKHVNDDQISVDKHEMKSLLMKALREFDENRELQFQIRFVPPDRMEHFKLSSRRFFPYGESIFYKTTFASKLLIAFETALVIKRISDSSDKRVIYMETGLPRTIRNIIEEVKEALYKKKVSFDTMGNVSSIPSMITSYETYFVPQKNGKKYVEFDQLPPAQNIRDISDELKFFRDTLVSALEVPPSYLNLEENLSNKNALTFENQLFARTVVSYQVVLGKHLKNLFSKIYKMVYQKIMPLGINIGFFPPRMLELEREAEHVETISRLINALKEFGINQEYLKRKYLSIDWDELEEFATRENIDKKITPPPGEATSSEFSGEGF